MKRPDIPAMDEIEAVIQDIEDMENAVRTLKNRLRQIPATMATQLTTQEECIQAARYLYWMVSEIPSEAIGLGLLGIRVHELSRYIGTAIADINCRQCSKPIQFRSRQHIKETLGSIRRNQRMKQRGYAVEAQVICETCLAESQQEWHQEWAKREEEREARLYQLSTMPYREYLKTPEWQERRKQHLKSAGFRCQICNSAGGTLNVHHRTYERRGHEYFKDLIALCQTCHELFHREGRLAET